VAGAVDVLKAAGFAEDNGSDPGLCLRRDDPGLLWLVCGQVQTVLASVEQMMGPVAVA